MTYTEDEFARAELLSALLQRVGYAVWQAAECEDTLAHYVVVRLRSSRGVGEERGRELLEKAQKRTFGHLLRELRDVGILTKELEQRLQFVVEERNWLVHNARREHRAVLKDLSDLERLVERITQLADEATAVNSLLGAELEHFIVESGVDRQLIDTEAARIQAEWGY